MNRRAFSIIELVVVIGIIMILIGIIMPAIGGVRAQAQSTVSLSNARQIATMITSYADEYDNVFPIADDRFWFRTRVPGEPEADADTYGRRWQWALIDAGFLTAEQAGDPDYLNATNFNLSMTLSYAPQLMTPETIQHPDDRRTSPIRTDQVAFPSGKGSLAEIIVGDAEDLRFWCCTYIDPPGAVAFLDGSAESVAWHQLLEPSTPPIFGIGYPVGSTWNGVRGRDR